MDIPNGPLSFIAVFLIGLGLNLTPCVYPMLSVTASLFSGQKGEARDSFLRALAYVLGMATMLSLLGVTAALTGSLFGSLLQNRWVLLGISVLLILLALSMFGVYSLQAPAWFLSRLGRRKRTVDFFGLFLSGLLVGIFAAPCIGPPVVALLILVGTRADPVFGFFTFFVMSLGLGAPYFLLGTFSPLLHRLPRSGIWLLWIEKLFGVILLALAGFYLLLAFYPEWLPRLWPVALVAGGLYLGFLEHSVKYSPLFLQLKKTLGVFAVIAGLSWPFFGMHKERVVWEMFRAERIEEAKAAGRPVIMDFYADWCIPCHELDQYTYSDKQVIEALTGFVRLKVDLTDPDQGEAMEAIGRFDIVGVPTIVFLDPQGKEVKEARLTGFAPPEEFLDILSSPRFGQTSSTEPKN